MQVKAYQGITHKGEVLCTPNIHSRPNKSYWQYPVYTYMYVHMQCMCIDIEGRLIVALLLHMYMYMYLFIKLEI